MNTRNTAGSSRRSRRPASGRWRRRWAVARLADACNIVRDDRVTICHKLAVLRSHCDAAERDYATIEKTHVQQSLLARAAAAVASKHERLAARGPVRALRGTVSEAIDLIGAVPGRRYRVADR
jgi:hypothetical protein